MQNLEYNTKKPGPFRIPAIYKRENKQWKVNLRLRYNRLFLQQLLVLSSEEKVSEYRLHILHGYLPGFKKDEIKVQLKDGYLTL